MDCTKNSKQNSNCSLRCLGKLSFILHIRTIQLYPTKFQHIMQGFNNPKLMSPEDADKINEIEWNRTLVNPGIFKCQSIFLLEWKLISTYDSAGIRTRN